MTQELKTSDVIEGSDLEKTLNTANVVIPTQEIKEKEDLISRIVNYLETNCESYFRPRSFERWEDGRFYKMLGVDYFKKIIPTSGTYVARLIGWRPIASESSKELGLRKYEKFTRLVESIHVIMFPIFTGIMVMHLVKGNLKSAGFAAVTNLVVNVYPYMLQRYNRARIYNALEEIESRGTNYKEK